MGLSRAALVALLVGTSLAHAQPGAAPVENAPPAAVPPAAVPPTAVPPAAVPPAAGAASPLPASASTSELLRAGNAAALAGDWATVAALVDPLFLRPLASADLGEAHRLAGIAAFFRQRLDDAERHFVGYLQIDLDGRLDPALYPPEVLAFFNDVASRHASELRALRIRPRRFWWLTLIPPAGQWQNGDHTKAFILGGTLAGLLGTNIATYTLLRQWCEHTEGSGGGGLSCEDGGNHNRAATRVRPINIGSGVAFLAVYLYGVFDGVRGYRRKISPAVQPFVSTTTERNVVGIQGSF